MATNNVPAGTEQRFLGATNIAALAAAKALPVEQIERKLEEFFDLLGATNGAGTVLPELAGYCEAMLGRLLEAQPVAKPTDPLAAAVAHHTDELFDVVALLDAAAGRIDEATPSPHDDPGGADTMHNTLRLVQMAADRVKAAAEDMLEHS